MTIIKENVGLTSASRKKKNLDRDDEVELTAKSLPRIGQQLSQMRN